jgi:polysaccharide deacetylase 2 family uncharacterized protein YibQ
MSLQSVKDSLLQPMKGRAQKRKGPLALWLSRFLIALPIVFVLFIAGWIVITDNPYGGSPVITLALEQGGTPQSESQSDIHAALSQNRDGVRAGSSAPQRSPTSTDPRIITVEPEGLEARVKGDFVALQNDPQADASSDRGDDNRKRLSAQPDSDLVEKTSLGGLIPRMGSNGKTPARYYARDRALDDTEKQLPKIALVITGLGLSQTSTSRAISELPADITLAFSPYGHSLQRWTTRARENGFEYFLQMPMEPFDYPDNDPGPHTLLSSASSDDNRQRAYWVMSRITNYVGIMNYMGARFTSEESQFASFMQDILSRGLLYLDDGSSARSLTDQLVDERADILKADMIIDNQLSQEAIDNRLLQLEAVARNNGRAIGVASAFPVTLEQVDKWTSTLKERGFVLVPVSTLVDLDNQQSG